MRIHSLKISGFGPFKDLQEIDFDRLTEDKIFLLEGPTGAGKSSVIDSIVWVLYGKTAHESASEILGAGVERIRSDYIADEDDTFVEMEFSVHNKRYSVNRSRSFKAAKKEGEDDKHSVKASLHEIGSTAEAATGTREVGAKVIELLGMTGDQFSKLVVLPQGDFAKFLQADVDSRKKLLQDIFKTFFYQRIEKYFEEERKSYDKLISAQKLEAEHHARNIGNLASDDFEHAPIQAVLLDLNEARSVREKALTDAIEEISPNTQEDREQEKVVAAKIAPLATRLTVLDESLAKIDEKAKLEGLKKSLEAQKDEMDESKAILAKLTKLAGIETLRENLEMEEGKQESALEEIDEDISDLTAAEVRAEITSLKPKVAALAKQVTQNERLEDDIEKANAKLELADEVEAAQMFLLTVDKEIEKCDKKIKAHEKKIADYNKAMEAEYAHIVARDLKKGSPCPVCGSKEHPKPLKGTVTMSPEQAQELQDELAEYKSELGLLKKSKTDSGKLATKKVGSVAEIKKEIAELEKKFEKAEKIFEEHSEKDERLELLDGSLEYFIAYETAEKAIEAVTKKIDALKAKAGIEDDDELDEILEYERDELEAQIKEYNESLVEVTARLKDMKDLPAPAGLQEEIDSINEQKKVLDSELTAIQTRIAIANTITTALEEARAGILAAFDELDALIAKAAPYKELDSLVSGGSGSKLTLTNFVLQERLEMVLEISNNHLRNISNGKYEFELSERAVNKRKKQAGLDIKVTNIMAGKTRPAETLSGGETFYASLALALGLAEVVKMSNGGIELGTIFIDEGFGSLSDETLEEVLGVLENLREDRFIGIISHVDSMKTRFPMRLEVRPTDAGPSTTHISTINND